MIANQIQYFFEYFSNIYRIFLILESEIAKRKKLERISKHIYMRQQHESTSFGKVDEVLAGAGY